MNMEETKTVDTQMTAVFPKQDGAISFVARLLEGRDDASNVVRKGRTVTFVVALQPVDEWGHSHMDSLRALVAYYGTLVPGLLCPKAKSAYLNGVRCIDEY